MAGICLLGLGTNLGNREANLHEAVQRLGLLMTILAHSPIYETSPWGVVDQPAFLNCCVQGKTDYLPEELMPALKQIEREMGREPTFRWGPRLIDIDLLFYDDLILNEPDLTLPHPRLPQRAFVLKPLADIAPDWIDPRTQQTVGQLLAQLESTTGL